jgi:type VI secretion system protein VasD
MRNTLFRLAALGLVAAVAGCAAPPPPPPPTVVNVTLAATADVNATPDKKGAPVVLRLYQLSSGANFGSAEFFALFNKDAATLGTDLVKREDFPLAPGQTKTTTLSPTDQVKSLGVFGGYRDFSHVTWRGTADIPPHQTTTVTITAAGDGITVQAQSAPPPAKPGK